MYGISITYKLKMKNSCNNYCKKNYLINYFRKMNNNNWKINNNNNNNNINNKFEQKLSKLGYLQVSYLYFFLKSALEKTILTQK